MGQLIQKTFGASPSTHFLEHSMKVEIFIVIVNLTLKRAIRMRVSADTLFCLLSM